MLMASWVKKSRRQKNAVFEQTLQILNKVLTLLILLLNFPTMAVFSPNFAFLDKRFRQ